MASVEQKIQKKIMDMLRKEHGAYTVKVMVASVNGVPDLLTCIPFTKAEVLQYLETHDTIGVFFGIEVKTPTTTDNTSPLQKYNLDKIQEAAGLPMVAWTALMVDEHLKQLKGN